MDDSATQSICPIEEQLPRLLMGALRQEEAEGVREHIQNCDRCQTVLATIQANLTAGDRPDIARAAPGRTHVDLEQQTATHKMRAPEAAQAKSNPPPGETVLFQPDTVEMPPSAVAPADSPASDQASGRPSDVYLVGESARAAGKGSTPSHYPFLSPPEDVGEIGRLGHYRVLRLLGEGGMGLVFEAEDSHLERRVALKVLRPELAANPQFRERFMQEARSAAAIPHDHIITIFQVGQINDIPYLAMEFLYGESLDDRLKREGQISVEETLWIGRQAALGLAAAHVRGLIHRDIKPANLWLETPPHGGEPRVKILDFGLARAAGGSAQLTTTGLIVGTPSYMSPEQARGQQLDPRSDLFSLGSVLYRMLSGRLPFSGNDALSVLTSLAIEEPLPLSQMAPKIPEGLARLVHRLLAKDREQRPATAALVADLLAQLERGEDVHSGEFAPSRQLVGGEPAAGQWRLERRWLLGAGAAAAILGAGIWGGLRIRRGGKLRGAPGRPAGAGPAPVASGKPIKIGILQSLSGTIGLGGSAVVDATMLAIDELNGQGGVLGRKIEPVIVDGQSDLDRFEQLAQQLIVEDKVATIFGCWTSAARKSVVPVVERHKHLLVYPLQYEGLEQSPNVIYTGASPNQQILPAVRYVAGILRKRRVFLIGSDYVFPRAANAIIRDALAADPEVAIVGEEYVPLGAIDLAVVMRKIEEATPDVILNTINGDSNVAFFRDMRARGLTPDRLPTVSFSIGENELRGINVRDLVGAYAAWNYFQSVDRPENTEFVGRFRAKYGPQRVVCDPMESGYFGVKLWAQGVEKAGSIEPQAIRQAMLDQRLDAPGGKVRIDAENGHTWKVVRLGQINSNGQFDIVWSSETPIRPEPFPATRTRPQWEDFLSGLYRGWGNRWEAPPLE